MAAVDPIAGDPRFFRRTGPHSLAAIAEAAGGSLPEGAAGDVAARMLTGVAPLQSAGPADVSFLDNRRYAALLDETRAGAVIVHPALAARAPAGCVAIAAKDTYLGWARVCALFHPLPPLQPGIHALACIDPAAQIDPTAQIGPFVVVEAGAEIGPRCRIAAGAMIGAGVVLGPDCRVGAQATVSHALLGARVYIYPGARIGQDGFGFATTAAGFVTVPQLGRVVLEDDVEVGANSTIDRGSAQDTVIGAGTRIDNLVQIGHNVRTGRCCVIVGQAGVAGSSILEDFVTLAGQAGIAGHLRIGKGARIGAQAGIMADVPPGVDYIGSPGAPAREWFRQLSAMRRLADQAGAKRRGTDTKAGAGAAEKTDTGSDE